MNCLRFNRLAGRAAVTAIIAFAVSSLAGSGDRDALRDRIAGLS